MKHDAAPTVYTIPSGQSFVDVLAQGVWADVEKDPLKLSEYLIFSPSRRACRDLREAFLRLTEGQPLLLPQMRPVGDIDADELSITLAADEDLSPLMDIPAAITPLRRQLLLAQMIMKLPGLGHSFDQAASLAAELGRLLDQVQTERLDFKDLVKLVPEEFAGHWQITLEFLKILTEHWPKILESQGVIDYADRRNRLLEAQAAIWQAHPPEKPVLVAGSTGTIPASADLIATIAALPQGAVVLPGLDQKMDEESWQSLQDDHPQFGMRRLLGRLGVDRASVQDWGAGDQAINDARVALVSEAMRPAETTAAWQNLDVGIIDEQALEGLSRVDCATPQEEAELIALMMRGVLEEPEKTAALITPDRNLARRVMMSLRRWGVAVDDSGGMRLSETPSGIWLYLIARMAVEKMAPVAALACLKHPLTSAGIAHEKFQGHVRALEKAVLRGPRPAPGFDGLRVALSQYTGRKKDELQEWLGRVEDILSPLIEALEEGATFKDVLTTHIAVAEKLAATDDETGAARLWRQETGEATALFFGKLLEVAGDVPNLSPIQYASLLQTLMGSQTVRPMFGQHPRLRILGQIEARLYSADLVILGGLNEGTWPGEPPHDPWMSRPMRREFGLPSPERSIGLAAHDFAQALASPNVVVTRAERVEGTPTVPARWLLRLDTVLQGLGLDLPVKEAGQWRHWVQELDKPAHEPQSCSRPRPVPPVETRPRKLSVTRIERWMRDPYEIYARYILGLKALDPIDADPGAAERGTVMHKALEEFIRAYPKDLPENAREELLRCGEAAFDEMKLPPEVRAFWWPRFEQMAHKFIEVEAGWREEAAPLATEISGEIVINAGHAPFTLTAKADRIDQLHGGGLGIIDYKTGEPPRDEDVLLGFSPQLPLEAAIAMRGGFAGIAANDVMHLSHWKVSGGRAAVRVKALDKVDVKAVAQEAEEGLRALIEEFDQPETAYPSMPRADRAPRYSDYTHLARVKEWGVTGEGDDG